MDSPPTKRLHILIVDDLPDNIGILAGALDDDYDIQFAHSGQEALTLIEQDAPDLVMLDIMMPGIDGLETLRRLRAASWGREVPVILITADSNTSTQVNGLEAGADDFLVKPVVVPVLLARVRNVIERHALMKAQAQLVARLESANHELARVSELHAAIFNSAGEGIYSTDQSGICIAINPAALVMLGYHRNEILGQHQHDVFHHSRPDGSHYPAIECPVFATLHDGQTRTVEESFIRKNGDLLPVQLTVTAMRIDGKIIGVEVMFQDISERQRMEQELLRLATTDELTGILNRRRFFELGNAERNRVVRYNQPTGLLMLDLDHFKQVNDHFGHAAGDMVLTTFTDTVNGLLRGVDVFGRVGGEEFAALLPQTDIAGTLVFAERLREGIEGLRIPALGDVRVTVSIGATVLTAEDTSIEVALLRADCALYEAKSTGRNRVCVQHANPATGLPDLPHMPAKAS
jgi:diguanylate cyclase (GGDEF)-like protein/PAS domain S-box-containing protein